MRAVISCAGLSEEAYCYNLGTDRPLFEGYVYFSGRNPFGWSRTLEPASHFIPGVVAVSLEDDRNDYIAAGEAPDHADIWDFIPLD